MAQLNLLYLGLPESRGDVNLGIVASSDKKINVVKKGQQVTGYVLNSTFINAIVGMW